METTLNSYSKTTHRLNLAITGAALLFISITAFLTIGAAVDDAFIVYRYVDRFVEQKGLTFNDGEYVEGFTSLLWTLLLSLISLVGIKPHIASILVNYISILLCALSLNWLLTILCINRLLRVIALLLFSISILYFRVVFLGLEFGVFIWFLVLFFCFFLMGLGFPDLSKASKPASWMTGFLAAALFALRPESIFLLPLLLGVVYFFKRNTAARTTHFWYSIGSFIPFLISVILWRLFYYGEFLPNSVIAKSVSITSFLHPSYGVFSRRQWVLDSMTYLREAYITNPVLLFTLVLAFVSVLKGKQVFEIILLFVPILWQHIIIVENGGDWMPFYRFLIIYVPIFITCFALITQQIWNQSRLLGSLGIIIFGGLHLYGNTRYIDFRFPPNIEHPIIKEHLYQVVGSTLNDIWLEGDILIAEAIGRIGYAAPTIYIHDPSGLTDKILARDITARRSFYGRTNWRYSIGLEPAVIVLHHWPHQKHWETFDVDYPTNYAFYCLPPLPEAVDNEWIYVIIAQDRVARYGTALMGIGAKEVAYQEIKNLEGPEEQMCNFGSSAQLD